MSSGPHPLIVLVKAANYDLTAAKAKLSEIERQIAAMNLGQATTHTCDDCADLEFKSPQRLAEHRYLRHDGPDPEHWRTAETLAAQADDDTHDPTVRVASTQ